MKKGDRGFFYHSREGLAIVGIIEIVQRGLSRSERTRPAGSSWSTSRPREPLKTPVTLAAIKAEPRLAKLALVRQGRLSVSPVAAEEWRLLCKMGGVAP